MFTDDLDLMKNTLKELHSIIGVYDISYSGYNQGLVDTFGDAFTFQCELDKFIEYCNSNNIEYKKEKMHKRLDSLLKRNYWVYSATINENIYVALEEIKII